MYQILCMKDKMISFLARVKAKEEIFMSTLTKEQVKAIVKGNNFQSVSDVSAYLKNIIKDVI